MTTTLERDAAKAERFAGRMMETLNHAGLGLMISIGHRTKLFDVLERLEPSTASNIAGAAGLQERYVREWCDALTVGGVLEYDATRKTYRLPAEHAEFVTRSHPQNNLAALMQYISVMGSVEDEIVECFQKGGGVPYSQYPRFHDVMAEDSGQSVLPVLVDQILPLVPGLTEKLEAGIEVLDMGCGRGRALTLLARTFPNSQFTGWDLSQEAIAYARQEAAGLSNIRFEVHDLTNFPRHKRFDLVTAFDAVHDQARPDKVLAGISHVLKPEGVFLMQDIQASSQVEKNMDHPIGTILYAISTMHCMTVSLAQGGMGLGSCWGEEKAREMLRDAGFTNVTVRRLPHDIQNQYYISRKN